MTPLRALPSRWAAQGRRLWAWLTRRLRGRTAETLEGPAGGAPAPPAPLAGSVSVVIPALNESARIAQVVRHALADPATAEVIVVDDSSIDDTAALARAAGARVITSTMLGKGASMHDGLRVATRDFIVYLDGDLSGLGPGIVGALAHPLAEGRADFVKARFGRGGGRVTELTAKPMLKVFFPELAHLGQPLGGLIAVRRALLQQLEFEEGYGVDIGLVLDANARGARIEEVDIGQLEHDSQPLVDLAAMANEVARVIYSRARAAGRLHVEQITAMYEAQRQAVSSIDYVLTRRRGRRRLVLLGLDGTLSPQHFVVELARRTGHLEAVQSMLEREPEGGAGRSERLAALFRFVHRRQFEAVARELELRRGVVAWVNRLRRAGFMVGVVSESYFVAAEVMRRRVFADFALAHMLQFANDVCTGELRPNPAFAADGRNGARAGGVGAVIEPFRAARDEQGGAAFEQIWAVGSQLEELRLLQAADRAFLVEPRSPRLRNVPGVVEFGDYVELAQIVEHGGDSRAAA